MRHIGIFLGCAFACAVTLASPAARAQAADPTAATAEVEPPEYPPPSTRWKVAGVGFAATGVFYGIGAGLSYVYPTVPGMKDLRIPVAGPWIATAHTGCGTDLDCSDALVVVRTILFVLDGVAQAGSIGTMIEGIFMPTQEAPVAPAGGTPRAPAAPPKPQPGGSEKNLFFVPGPLTGGAVGIGVVGRF